MKCVLRQDMSTYVKCGQNGYLHCIAGLSLSGPKRFCAVKPVQSHSNLLYKTEKNNAETRFLICCTTTNMKIQSSKDLQVSGSLRTWKTLSAF